MQKIKFVFCTSPCRLYRTGKHLAHAIINYFSAINNSIKIQLHFPTHYIIFML